MLLVAALLTLATAAPPTATELEGTWSLHMNVVTANKLPIVGNLRSNSWTFALVQMKASEGALAVEQKVCGAEVSGGLVRTRVPDRYLRKVPVKRYPATLEARSDTQRFHSDTGVFSAGFDASCAEVPHVASDPCVYDWDADGHPGATVEVKIPMFAWVDVYVTQRNHLVLEGVAESADRITGQIEVLEVVNFVIGSSRKMFDRNPVSNPVPGESVFTLTRLEAGAGCSEVLALR